MFRSILLIISPISILMVGFVVAWQLFASSPDLPHKTVEILPLTVDVDVVKSQTVQIAISSQGTVTPRADIEISLQVAGRIIDVSKNFNNGGFFKKGDFVLKIDQHDYELEVVKAEASLASAQRTLAQAEAESKLARHDLNNVTQKNVVSAYALGIPQVDEAKAQVRAAKASLESARLQLERTVVRAPFDGILFDKKVDVGQYVTSGVPLARIYSIDVAEIRLPISNSQSRLINPSVLYNPDDNNYDSPTVTIRTNYTGKEYSWEGTIVRSESRIDQQSGLLYVVAQVQNPYKHDANEAGRPPLAAGMFVEAEIEGRKINDVYVLPHAALTNGNQVWVVNSEERIESRFVNVLYTGPELTYVDKGLTEGDKVVVSALEAPSENMKVRLKSDQTQLSKNKVSDLSQNDNSAASMDAQ